MSYEPDLKLANFKIKLNGTVKFDPDEFDNIRVDLGDDYVFKGVIRGRVESDEVKDSTYLRVIWEPRGEDLPPPCYDTSYAIVGYNNMYPDDGEDSEKNCLQDAFDEMLDRLIEVREIVTNRCHKDGLTEEEYKSLFGYKENILKVITKQRKKKD